VVSSDAVSSDVERRARERWTRIKGPMREEAARPTENRGIENRRIKSVDMQRDQETQSRTVGDASMEAKRMEGDEMGADGPDPTKRLPKIQCAAGMALQIHKWATCYTDTAATEHLEGVVNGAPVTPETTRRLEEALQIITCPGRRPIIKEWETHAAVLFATLDAYASGRVHLRFEWARRADQDEETR